MRVYEMGLDCNLIFCAPLQTTKVYKMGKEFSIYKASYDLVHPVRDRTRWDAILYTLYEIARGQYL